MRLQRIIVLGLMLALTTALGGCASRSDSASSSPSTSGSTSTSASKKAVDAQPRPTASPLSKIEIGMTDTRVRELLGEPATIQSYSTSKNWIPFYFGSDTYRFDWIYSDAGRVIFANINRFSRSIKVVEVVQNPDEP